MSADRKDERRKEMIAGIRKGWTGLDDGPIPPHMLDRYARAADAALAILREPKGE
jgi:hypothetical protein